VRTGLEHVQNEVMSPVVPLLRWIVVSPLAVVDGDLHFGRVSMVETIATPVVLVSPKVLRIVNVRVVVKSLIVSLP